MRKLRTAQRATDRLRQKCRRLERKLAKTNAKHREEQRHGSLLEIERTKGGKGKRLTLSGTISLAIRRNFGNTATADIGAILLEDISRFTVARAEIKAGTALIASSRLFFHAMYQDIASRTLGTFKLAIHSYMQDATNSGILKGSKLAGLILRSAYLRESVPNDQGDCSGLMPGWEFEFDNYFATLVRVADVLPVHGGDSLTTASQTLKQLEGLGCWSWKSIAEHDDLQHMCLAAFACVVVGNWEVVVVVA